MKKIAFVCALALTTFVSSAAYADITVQGSTTVASVVITPNQAAIEAASGQKLQVVANGSGRGIVALAEGKAQIAMISATLEETAKKAEKDSPAVAGKPFKASQIGTSKVAFIVNPGNAVKKLTMEQLAGILTGTIKNWKEVGGADLPIVTVVEVKGGGIRSMVESDVLAKKEVVGSLKEVQNGSQVAPIVSQLPAAIGIAPASALSAKVAKVETPKEVSQPLILVTLGEPTAEMKKVIAAATKFAPK